MKVSDLPAPVVEYLRDVWELRRDLAPNQDLYGFRWDNEEWIVRDIHMIRLVNGEPRLELRRKLAGRIMLHTTRWDSTGRLLLLIGPRGKAAILMQPGNAWESHTVTPLERRTESLQAVN